MRSTDPFDTSIIIASLTGDATEDEIRELQAWRGRSAANEREYLRLARLWLRVGEAASPPYPERAPTAQAVIALASDEEVDDQPRELRRGRNVAWTWAGRGAAAAALVVAFTLGTWTWYRERPLLFGAESLVTGLNEIATV